MTNQAREASLACPLIETCKALYAEAANLGHGAKDMAAVLCAIEARTDILTR